MKRDTIKTILGLAVIGLIVFATYLYGNAQRQAQIKNDEKSGTQVTAGSPTASPAVAAVTATPTPSVAANTKPVQSPSSNSIQGGGTATPKASTTPKPSATPKASSTPKPGTVAGSATTVPVTGGTTAPLPDTGAPELGMLGVGAIVAALVWLKVSQRSLLAASRTRR